MMKVNKRNFLTTALLIIFLPAVCQAQVLILTFSALTSSPDQTLMKKLAGDWVVTKAVLEGQDRLSEFEGVMITFPKCKGKVYKAGNCDPIEITGDDKTAYFKQTLGESPDVTITSRKDINKEAKEEDAGYEKVKYEKVTTLNTELEYAFKYKKGVVQIEALSEGVTEFFILERPPKDKKK